MNHRLVTVSALLAALTGVGSAFAADAAPSVEDIKAAEQDFNRGREAYKGANYVEAGEYFESADSHAPNDRVLELAINAREKAGNLDRAATLAQYGLETYPNSDRIRKMAGPLVDRGRAEMFQVTVQCDEACNLLDGTRLVHGGPTARRIVFLTPGDHTIRAAWSDDRAESKNVGGKAGETAALEFQAPPIPKKPELPPAQTGTGNPALDKGPDGKPFGLPPIYFLIGAGTTAALGGVTIWSGIDTVNNPGADKVKRECDQKQPDCTSLYDKGRSSQLRTNILIGATSVVGVATAVVGIFATNWNGDAKREASVKPGPSISPWIAYHYGPTLGATGRF
ncbi:MAG TPA: hypothetical protein VF395_21145 [Polyangiaceae bacterium]